MLLYENFLFLHFIVFLCARGICLGLVNDDGLEKTISIMYNVFVLL